MRNRWHNGGATIEEEAEDCDEHNEDGYRALNTTLELDLGEFLNPELNPVKLGSRSVSRLSH